MARRKRGNPIDGWVVVDKPLEVTSTQVVSKVRWAFRAQKAGHSGTLDPLATGVLAVALGEATKTVPVAQEGAKTYAFTVRLGQATSTDDAEGEVIATSPDRPSDEEIRAALAPLTGEILQVPPAFSAVRVEGERAYDLARSGELPELVARPLTVHRLELVARPDPDHAEIEMTCGKGGYVRSIARDLGAALGCHAHVSALRRTATGPFGLEGALSFADLDRIREEGAQGLLPVEAGLAEIPEMPLGEAEAARLRNGMAVPATRSAAWGETVWASRAGMPVAICTVKAGQLHPDRVFVTGR